MVRRHLFLLCSIRRHRCCCCCSDPFIIYPLVMDGCKRTIFFFVRWFDHWFSFSLCSFPIVVVIVVIPWGLWCMHHQSRISIFGRQTRHSQSKEENGVVHVKGGRGREKESVRLANNKRQKNKYATLPHMQTNTRNINVSAKFRNKRINNGTFIKINTITLTCLCGLWYINSHTKSSQHPGQQQIRVRKYVAVSVSVVCVFFLSSTHFAAGIFAISQIQYAWNPIKLLIHATNTRYRMGMARCDWVFLNPCGW